MKKYCPSNGSEGEEFITHFCYNCIHGKYEHTGDLNDKPCDILSRSFAFDINHKDYPTEWTYDENGKPTCTAWIKWNWARDDDGNWIDPPETPPDNPNQLVMPFIFDELEINQLQKQTLND